MKRFVLAGLAVMFAVAFTASVWGEEVPWKAGDPKPDAKPAAGAAAGADTAGGTSGDLKADLPPAQYARIVKPIEASVEQAEKAMEECKKELDKPAEKRNAVRIQGLKINAARFYQGAAVKAKAGEALVTKGEQKQAIADQYEKPNKEKAVALYLEIADELLAKKDFRGAYATYKQVLVIDPENATAKAAIEKIEKDNKEATTQKKGRNNQGGGADDAVKDPTDIGGNKAKFDTGAGARPGKIGF